MVPLVGECTAKQAREVTSVIAMSDLNGLSTTTENPEQEMQHVSAAARRFGVSRKTVYNMHRKGEVTIFQHHSRALVRVAELRAALTRHALRRDNGMPKVTC